MLSVSGVLWAGNPLTEASFGPAVLRHNIRTDTLGFEALNFGAAKGSTHGHVVIFPTASSRQYLKTRNP